MLNSNAYIPINHESCKTRKIFHLYSNSNNSSL